MDFLMFVISLSNYFQALVPLLIPMRMKVVFLMFAKSKHAAGAKSGM